MFKQLILQFLIAKVIFVIVNLGVIEGESEDININYGHQRFERDDSSASTKEMSDCGGAYKLTKGETINVIAPREADSYEPNMNCLWTFTAGNCIPQMKCGFVDLRPEFCEDEYLEISDGVGGGIKLCGKSTQDIPRRASNRGRDLFLRFKTSNDTHFNKPYTGFKCQVLCQKTFTSMQKAYELPPDNVVQKTNYKCVCGVKQNSGNDRIVGGATAKEFEFPWQAAVVTPRTRSPVCGGTVINNKWILTAAHCFWFKQAQPADYQILLHAHLLSFKKRKGHDKTAEFGQLGSMKAAGWDHANKTDKDEQSLRFNIAEIIWHPLFTKQYDFDVALVKVDGFIPLTGEHAPIPICLPPVGAYGVKYAKGHATVSGWGSAFELAGASTRLLQKLHIPVLRTVDCSWMMPDHSLTRRMLCAGLRAGEKDACQGDSGGPLISKLSKNQYTQIGIVSWGEGCARGNRPGIYSRLTELVQWVHFHTRRSGATWCQKSLFLQS